MDDDTLNAFKGQADQLITSLRNIVEEKEIHQTVVAGCMATVECRIAIHCGMPKDAWLSEKSRLWDELQKEYSELFKNQPTNIE